jgi:uncharacterized membrane protein YoaK (UPF0700 family)/anti-anti-sigma regulatory factor
MKSRLAISLSWIGGYVNVVALLHCGHVLSHQTGNTTWFGEAAVRGGWSAAAMFGFLVLIFFLGAVGSSLMTEWADRRSVRSKYILPMAVEALLLIIFALGVPRTGPWPLLQGPPLYWMTGLAALAMGLQNATITRISGAVVRTTHLTGVVTDLGLESVQLLLWYWDKLRGRWGRAGRVLRISQRHPTLLRVLLLASIYGSFLFGVVAGTLLYARWPGAAMLPPILFLLMIVLLNWRKPVADVRELDPLNDPEMRAAGLVQALLPPELGIYRLLFHKSVAHSAPHFQKWVERLPGHWRVVILALSPLTRLDSNAAEDLRGAVANLSRDGRRLVLCGVSPVQYRLLRGHGVTSLIEPQNICSDLEFAIARGISLINEEWPPVLQESPGMNNP